MTYRPKPPIAAWIARERARLGLKPLELAERLRAVGTSVTEQTIRVWESYAGRNPSAANLDALERVFGTEAPRDEPAGPDLAAVVAAIDRLTAAVEAQTRAQDERSQATIDALAQVLLRLGGLPGRSEGGEPERHSAPAQ